MLAQILSKPQETILFRIKIYQNLQEEEESNLIPGENIATAKKIYAR